MTAVQPRNLVIVGGTWETKWGLLGSIVRAVPSSNPRAWRTTWVDYPASYATPEAFQDSEDRGVTALILALRQLPLTGQIAVVGYSQGAGIVERALREMADTGTVSNQQVLNRVAYVGLVANPYRAAGDQVGPDPGGSGVIGPLAPKGQVPIRQTAQWQNFALAGDLICACPADSLIREIHPFTRWMSVQTPDKWAADVLGRLSVRWFWKTFPEFRDLRRLPNLLKRIHDATTAAYHYQTTGIHMQYAVRSPGVGYTPATAAIAHALEEIAWQTK